MTKYDPFSFGTVNLGDKAKAPATPSSVPDDMLFAEAGPMKQAPPATDTSWALLEESVDGLLPGASATQAAAVEFGADILGEVAPEAAPLPPPVQPKATPAKPKAAAVESTPRSTPTRPTPRAAGASIAATEAAARAAAVPTTPRHRSPPVMPKQRRATVAGLLVPLAVLGAGGTAASWFHLMAQNPVMAGITALLSVVGAAFAWLSLRG